MAGDVFKLVDSVAASPTVRLDMNDGVTWLLSGPSVDFSPPPLRRAINGTLLVDGSVQSASAYDNRLLRFTIELAAATTDAAATQVQLLNRELDRDSNTIMWQPSGATSPVFFRTLRTPVTQVQAISPLNTSQSVRVEVLAEPFALGLREDLAGVTVNNDPAAGSNGLFFDLTGVKGDVDTPAVILSTSLRAWGILGARRWGTPSDLTFFTQAESTNLGADTTNPGGGPDAAMSGTGTNNFVRTSFAVTATLAARLTWFPTFGSWTAAQKLAIRGSYRVFACVRRSDNTSAINVQCQIPRGGGGLQYTVVGSKVAVPATTARQVVDLGLFSFDSTVDTPGRYGPRGLGPAQPNVVVAAERVSGAGTIDWDYLAWVPADDSLLLWYNIQNDDILAGTGFVGGVFDATNEAIYTAFFGTGLFDGTSSLFDQRLNAAGGFPVLRPNQTNRFFLIVGSTGVTGIGSGGGLQNHTKTTSDTMTASYWPRYLHARPATT